jgi:hypothetical protein
MALSAPASISARRRPVVSEDPPPPALSSTSAMTTGLPGGRDRASLTAISAGRWQAAELRLGLQQRGEKGVGAPVGLALIGGMDQHGGPGIGHVAAGEPHGSSAPSVAMA